MRELWLLRLYPREWRERYGPEVAAMLADEKRSLRLVVDLLAGAIDARLNPQTITRGASMPTPLFRCAPAAATRADLRKSNLTILGGTLLFSLLYIVARHQFPAARPYLDTLAYTSFSVPIVIGSYWTELKPYPPRVRIVLIFAMSGVIVAILLAAAAIAVHL